MSARWGWLVALVVSLAMWFGIFALVLSARDPIAAALLTAGLVCIGFAAALSSHAEAPRMSAGWRREQMRIQAGGHEVVYDERLSGGRR